MYIYKICTCVCVCKTKKENLYIIILKFDYRNKLNHKFHILYLIFIVNIEIYIFNFFTSYI